MSKIYEFNKVISDLEKLTEYVEKLEGAKSSKVLKEKEEAYQTILKSNIELRIELENANTKIHEQAKKISRMLEKLEEKNLI